jgi:hypothetical protein
MRSITLGVVAASLSLASVGARAHHSYTEYDDTKTVEIEGKLIVVAWQNPHTRLQVQTVDSENRTVVWEVESGPVNGLRRRQVPLDIFKVGDVVKVAGWPSKRVGERMYGTNLLSTAQQEVVLQRAEPRWGTAVVYSDRPDGSASTTGLVGGAPTLFRVWSSDPAIDPETRNGFLNRAQISLTEPAKLVVAAFNPVTQTTTDGCVPKGMPILMGQPFPIEFTNLGDSILLHLEEYDTVRTIHLAGVAAAASQDRSPLGYSAGHWEGATLIVDTDRIDAPYFNSSGVPLGRSAHVVERFSVSEDGRRLGYTLEVTDPETFTEPARATRAWLARAGERLLPYDCKAPLRRQ